MTIRSYRGDAPAVSKIIAIPRPIGYVSGEVRININNKTISHFKWDAAALIDAWNNSIFPETNNITASLQGAESGAYGVQETILFTSDVAGEDFFVTVSIGDDAISDEVQRLTFDPAPDGGTFTLTYSGQTTSSITFVDGDSSTTAANIKTALEGLSNIGSGEVEVTAISAYVYDVKFVGTLADQDLPLMTCDYTSLTGGDVAITVTTQQNGIIPSNEKQTLSMPAAPTGGSFTLTYAGQTTTVLTYNSSAANVQGGLEALSNIAVGDVECTGGPLPATPVVIEFKGALAGQNVALITADGSSLTGGTSNVTGLTTTRNGSAGTNQKSSWILSSYSPSTMVEWFTRDSSGTVHRSASFRADTSLADMKSALVGMVVGYRLANNPFYHYNGVISASHYPIEDYVIQSGDIDLAGSLNVALTAEFKGNFANRPVPVSVGSGTSPCICLVPAGTTFDITSLIGVVNPSQSYEIQYYEIVDNTLPGAYTLTVYDKDGGSHVTAPITYDADSQAITDAINTALGGKFVSAIRDAAGGTDSKIAVFYQNYGYQIVNMTQLSINSGNASVVTTQEAGGGASEVQQVSVQGTGIRDGSITITYAGQTTASIDWDATSSEIQAALEALSNIAAGDVIVSGNVVNGFTITFLDTLGDVSQVSVLNSLDNAILTVTEALTGGVIAYCDETVRNKGPECFDDPLNYDPQGLPSDGDSILFEFGQAACRWGIKQRDTFIVYNTTTNTFELTSKRPIFQNEQKVRLRVAAGGSAPTGLTANNAYYIINADGRGKFQLSTTLNGSAIDVSSTGSGILTLELQLALVRKPARYSYEIGLPRNNSGFEEYRPRYLEATIDEVILGEGDGSDSGLQRYDLGDRPSDITVYNTGSGSEPDTPAACFLINDDTTDITAYGGEIGLAPFLDEECVLRDIKGFDITLKTSGGVTARNIILDKGSTLVGEFISDSLKIGM